jgi:hypothetical protein
MRTKYSFVVILPSVDLPSYKLGIHPGKEQVLFVYSSYLYLGVTLQPEQWPSVSAPIYNVRSRVFTEFYEACSLCDETTVGFSDKSIMDRYFTSHNRFGFAGACAS